MGREWQAQDPGPLSSEPGAGSTNRLNRGRFRARVRDDFEVSDPAGLRATIVPASRIPQLLAFWVG